LIAVKVNTSTQIFSITLDPVAETYTVTIIGTLDGAAGTEIGLNTGGTDPGNDSEIYFYGENIQVRVTGYDENGAIGEVNSSKPGMGVNNNWINNPVDADSQQLFMVFSNTTPTDPYGMTAAAITANSLDIGEEAVWKVYNTNGYSSDEFKADPSLWYLVNEGSSEGSTSADTTFFVEGGLNPSSGEPYSFDAIVLEASDGGEYRILDATTYTSDSGSNIKITYNSIGVQVFDADNDPNEGHVSFEVTFDADGNIIGTQTNEVIDGNSLSNMISGGSGDDVLSGNVGDDILDGGAGNDTLTGGDGNDTFKVGDGNDTIIDYGSGDNIDASGVVGADDYSITDADPSDGKVELNILDASDVTIETVDIDNMDTVTLDSLLGYDPGDDDPLS
jgi:hypothetical protein